MELVKELARVTYATVGREDRGILVCMIGFDFGGAGQSMGIVLDTYDKAGNSRVGTAEGCEWIRRVLDLFKERDFLSLSGRTVYVLRANGIGPILGLEMPPFDGGTRLLLTDVFVGAR